MQDVYRSAASIVLLKPAGDPGVFQVLLLHKPRKKDSWQLPQGGTENGETIRDAALRELNEEAGISDVQYLGESEHIYQYDFPASFRRFRPDHVCGQKIHFVFAIAAPNAEVKVDAKEIDRYVWIFPNQITQYVKRKEYLQLANRLIKEAIASATR